MPFKRTTFGEWKVISLPGDDGKSVRYPVELIDRDDVGTPRQSAKTKVLRVTVKISNTLRPKWPENDADLIKAMYQLAKEKLIKNLTGNEWKIDDFEVIAKGACPYDPNLIEEPIGAVIEIEINPPPIGFKRQ